MHRKISNLSGGFAITNKRPASNPTIISILSEYAATLDDNGRHIVTRLSELLRSEGSAGLTLARLRTPDGRADLQVMCAELVRTWGSREKGKVATALRKLAGYLRRQYDIELRDDELPIEIRDVTERRLDMLRFLQTPHSMQELEDRYLTSPRTLREDLNALVNGWDILGFRIAIQRDDRNGKISYASTVHPVFLPFNLTEAYAMVVGMPRLARGTVYEETVHYWARAVTRQLSSYAVRILAQAAPELYFDHLPAGLAYRQEHPMLLEERNAWLLYLAKTLGRCRIRYADDTGTVLAAEGVPTLRDPDATSIRLEGQEPAIPLDRILSLEPLEPYH